MCGNQSWSLFRTPLFASLGDSPVAIAITITVITIIIIRLIVIILVTPKTAGYSVTPRNACVTLA